MTQCLTRTAIDGVLRFVAGLPAGSTIVLPDDALDEEVRERKRGAIPLFEAQGGAWLTFFNPDE